MNDALKPQYDIVPVLRKDLDGLRDELKRAKEARTRAEGAVLRWAATLDRERAANAERRKEGAEQVKRLAEANERLRDANERLREVSRTTTQRLEDELALQRATVESLRRDLRNQPPRPLQMEAEHARALGEKNAEIGTLARSLEEAQQRNERQQVRISQLHANLGGAQQLDYVSAERLKRVERERDDLREQLATELWLGGNRPAIWPPPGSGAAARARSEAQQIARLERRVTATERQLVSELPAASREVLDQRLKSLERKDEARREREERREARIRALRGYKGRPFGSRDY